MVLSKPLLNAVPMSKSGSESSHKLQTCFRVASSNQNTLKFIDNRFMTFLQQNKILNARQYVYQEKTETQTTVSDMMNKIREKIAKQSRRALFRFSKSFGHRGPQCPSQ